jgi:serine/threonine-protein phosphatase CPPED1
MLMFPTPLPNGGSPYGRRDPRFVLISDRTAGARPGVFERGLAVTDLLAPDFAIQLGDLIEGYSHDGSEIDRQWEEIDSTLEAARTPIVRVPGNHDASNSVQAEIWRQRYGPTYFFWRQDDVLFCVLDTQDPPAPYADPVLAELTVERIRPGAPHHRRAELERMHDWNGTQPANLSAAQLDYFEDVLARHRDARWTFLCMHMPLWQGDHPAWRRIRRCLGERPYSAYAGHVHNYRHDVVEGRSHVRLGPTGGAWVLPGPAGNFDHVTLVTLTDDGPVLANLLLEGVRDVDGEALTPVATRSVPIF